MDLVQTPSMEDKIEEQNKGRKYKNMGEVRDENYRRFESRVMFIIFLFILKSYCHLLITASFDCCNSLRHCIVVMVMQVWCNFLKVNTYRKVL